MKTCRSCGALFESINPFRKHCDNCREREAHRERMAAFRADPYDLERLTDVPDEASAAGIIAQLEAAGIPSVRGLDGRYLGDVLLDGDSYGQLQVMVRKSDYDAAMDLLGLDDQGAFRAGELEPVFVAMDLVEATILIDQLRQAGIPAVLANNGEITTGITPTKAVRLGPENQILVHAADVEAAMEILGVKEVTHRYPIRKGGKA
jgi:hypothetical protein